MKKARERWPLFNDQKTSTFQRHMELWRMLLLTWLWSATRGQDQRAAAPVSCVVGETCVLPCNFSDGDVILIQWVKTKEDYLVYDYPPDEKIRQHAAFRGRTSLFVDEIPKGNASLRLTEVRVQDQGVYLCQAFTTGRGTEDHIELRVEAPVVSLRIEQKGDSLVCSSEGIYPQPSVSWTPASRHQTQEQQTENKLFSISSSLTFDPQPLQHYTCNISTHHSWKSATYSLHSSVKMSRDAILHCTHFVVPVNSVVWTFNDSQPIVTCRGADVDCSAPWRPFVENVSESGSLVLQGLSSEHEGVYLCELDTGTHIYFSRTELLKADSPNAAMIGGIVGVVLLCLIVILVVIVKKKCKKAIKKEPGTEPLNPATELTVSNSMTVEDPRKYYRKVFLDESTAHKNLKFSDNYRTVTHVEEEQPYPDDEDRFTDCPQVLSNTDLWGRQYWEVEWRGRTGVSIAVSYKGIRRRGERKECEFGLNEQSWSLWTNGTLCFVHNNNKVEVVPGEVDSFSGRVGVFLDSEAGSLSFYKVLSDEKPIHIHTFSSSFREPLFPGFRFGLEPGSSVSVVDLNTSVEHPKVKDPRTYFCKFSLDPTTAHKQLCLSEANRTVTHVKEEQPYPDDEDRFTDCPQVLSSTSLKRRCYWEVEWNGHSFSIAVSYRGIRRKGERRECEFGLNYQSWSLDFRGHDFYASHNGNSKNVFSLPVPSSRSCSEVSEVPSVRVGVFLDYEAGSLTFYQVQNTVVQNTELFPLHTFFSSFTEPLFLGFGLGHGSSLSLVNLKLSSPQSSPEESNVESTDC